jgi:hypothetical protein
MIKWEITQSDKKKLYLLGFNCACEYIDKCTDKYTDKYTDKHTDKFI